MLPRLRSILSHVSAPTGSTQTTVRMSSTFTLPSPHPPISITVRSYLTTSGLTSEKILTFSPFRRWITKLNASLNDKELNPDGYQLKGIEVTDVDMFGKKIGFLKCKADVRTDSEQKGLPGVVLLRGPSVALLVLLHIKGTPKDKLHAILAIQPRVAGGTLSMAEIPAGMLDDSGTFAGAAAKELEEEVGLKIQEDKLIPLSQLALSSTPSSEQIGFATAGEQIEEGGVDGYFSGAGLLDEVLTYHAYVHDLDNERELEEWKGKMTGLRDEGEKITLRIADLAELWRGTRDTKALCAWGLWEGLKREGKLEWYKD